MAIEQDHSDMWRSAAATAKGAAAKVPSVKAQRMRKGGRKGVVAEKEAAAAETPK